ncbi:MAG: 2-desacetyl-2-hydroxyethyl bacteriochlorophyllide A dehydrogenase [Verrucomicrobiales bacterium]|jgi:2-desacetyl-2-hydroxyethyl bacteriochlorophyllide A dehydrogenase
MRAAVVHEPNRITIDDVPEPEPGPNEVVVAVKANGICGSDLHLLDGEWSFVQYPVIPGHEFSGEIVEVGPGVDANLVGQRVAVDPVVGCSTCDHCTSGRVNLCRTLGAYGATRPGGSAERCVVGVQNLVPLPESLPFEAAAVAQPLACALHALNRVPQVPAQRVLVVGGGAAGLLLAQAVRASGASFVAVCEPVAARREVAARLDVDEIFQNIDEAVETHPEKFSLVIDATGKASVLPSSLEAADTGGTLLLFSVCAQGETASIEPVKLYERELTIVGSRGMNSTSVPALELLSSGQVKWEPLVTDQHNLDDLANALGRLRRHEGIKALTMCESPTISQRGS